MLKKKTVLKKDKECGENVEIIKLISLKKLVLVGKGKVDCLSRRVVEGDTLCLNIRVGEGEEGRKDGVDKVGGEVAVFKKSKKVELIKLEELDILIKNVFGSELYSYL